MTVLLILYTVTKQREREREGGRERERVSPISHKSQPPDGNGRGHLLATPTIINMASSLEEESVTGPEMASSEDQENVLSLGLLGVLGPAVQQIDTKVGQVR